MIPSRPSADVLNQKFVAWWKPRRKAKARYIIGHGLLWGLFTSLGSYLLIIRFDLEKFDIVEVAIRGAVFVVGGILTSYWFYRAQEKRFKQIQSPGN